MKNHCFLVIVLLIPKNELGDKQIHERAISTLKKHFQAILIQLARARIETVTLSVRKLQAKDKLLKNFKSENLYTVQSRFLAQKIHFYINLIWNLIDKVSPDQSIK